MSGEVMLEDLKDFKEDIEFQRCNLKIRIQIFENLYIKKQKILKILRGLKRF